MVIVFWLAGFAIIYTYILYPALLAWLAKGKTLPVAPNTARSLPQISVLMAVHNEEAVIKDKLKSLLGQDYPKDKLRFYIGSDNSSAYAILV